MAASTSNRIDQKGHGHREEYPANAAFSPGHILQLLSDGTVKKFATAGGKCERLQAVEDVGQGKTIADAYAATDRAQCVVFNPGDQVLFRVPASAVAILEGDDLISDGAGGVVKLTVTGSHTLYNATAASSAISNVGTATAFSNGSYTMPANTLQVGDQLTIKGEGILTSTTSTDTLTVTVLMGSTTLLTAVGPDATNNDIFTFEINLTVRSISGTTCTIAGDAVYTIGVPGTATEKSAAVAAFTIDSTAAIIIVDKGLWSATSASDSVRQDMFDIELSRINPNGAIAKALAAVDNSGGSSDAMLLGRWY